MLKSFAAEAPKTLSNLLVYEISRVYSREEAELAQLEVALPMGAVLAMNESGQYVPFGTELSPAIEGTPASEGVEAVEAKPAVMADKASAILISRNIEASEDAQPCAVLKRGCVVAKENLFWLPDITDTRKTAAIADLEKLGIIARA